MDLEFTITNQTISRTDTFEPRADSIGYLYAHFTFSSDWNDIASKTVVFSDKTHVYNILLDGTNKCAVPPTLIKSGSFTVSVFAEDTTPKRYTANAVTVWIWESGYEIDDSVVETDPPSLYAQILALFEAIPTTPPETMKKYISYTVPSGSSAASLSWTTDDEGNNLALTDAEIRIYIPTNTITVGQNGYIYGRINNRSGPSDYQSSSATGFSMAILGSYRSSFGYIDVDIKKFGNKLKLSTWYDRFDGTTYGDGRYISGTNFDVTTITNIYLSINGLTYFPTGTTVEIYGRTA